MNRAITLAVRRTLNVADSPYSIALRERMAKPYWYLSWPERLKRLVNDRLRRGAP